MTVIMSMSVEEKKNRDVLDVLMLLVMLYLVVFEVAHPLIQ